VLRSSLLVVLVGLLASACIDQPAARCARVTGPTPAAPLVLTRAPELQGCVTDVTRECSGLLLQAGGSGCQDNVWFATPPDTAPDAGVLVGDSTPVFVSAHGSFRRSSPAAIAIGEKIEIWTTGGVAYGAVQCPLYAPCYFGNQIVIVR